MGQETSSAGSLARLLVGGAGQGPGRTLDAAVAACERVGRDLSQWVGASGCHALFARALAEVRLEHPALTHVRVRANPTPGLDHVDDAVRDAGAEATAAALVALLVALLALLGRLVGDDIVEQLLAPGATPPSAPEAARASPDDARA